MLRHARMPLFTSRSLPHIAPTMVKAMAMAKKTSLTSQVQAAKGVRRLKKGRCRQPPLRRCLLTTMTALTEKCRYVQFICQGGNQNGQKRHFLCHLDTKTPSHAIYTSRWQGNSCRKHWCKKPVATLGRIRGRGPTGCDSRSEGRDGGAKPRRVSAPMLPAAYSDVPLKIPGQARNDEREYPE